MLKDDGLRILRAARFQAELGFTLTEAVLLSAAECTVGLLDEIVRRTQTGRADPFTDGRYEISDAQPCGRPPVSSGLDDPCFWIGAWPKLFGSLSPIDVLRDGLHGGATRIDGKFALLFHRAKRPHRFMTSAWSALRYAKREIKSRGERRWTRFADDAGDPGRSGILADALHFGLPAVKKAREDTFKALAAGRQRSIRPALCARGERCFHGLHPAKRLPESVRELAVGGRRSDQRSAAIPERRRERASEQCTFQPSGGTRSDGQRSQHAGAPLLACGRASSLIDRRKPTDDKLGIRKI